MDAIDWSDFFMATTVALGFGAFCVGCRYLSLTDGDRLTTKIRVILGIMFGLFVLSLGFAAGLK